jgi:hypothetical protein
VNAEKQHMKVRDKHLQFHAFINITARSESK